tara:strand:- start:15331 stop:15789 length:459 start_codon:yes stop_codon:yes gene_type:complete
MNKTLIQDLHSFEEIYIDSSILHDKDFKQIAEEAQLLKALFNEINLLAEAGGVPLQKTEEKLVNSAENIHSANNTLTKINRKKIATYIFLSGLGGVIIGGPVGSLGALVLCSSTGTIISASSLVIAATLGSISTGGIFSSITGLTHYIKKRL